tara:strand:+ start:205 stop:681 length:477 start_codon:yes stop_codon:yes gene_type:complete
MVTFVNNLRGRRLKTPADKAAFQGKNPANKTTGPNTTGSLQDPWRGTLDTNPLNDDFYQSSYTFQGQAPEVQERLEGLQFEYTNAFEEGNNEFARNFLDKYTATRGGSDSAEDKGLIEEDRIVRPENLSQIATQPAAGGNAIQDPNVAGKFPSQEVNV